MKKLVIILVVLLGIIYTYYGVKYMASLDKIEHELDTWLIYSELIDRYYLKNGEYPMKLASSDDVFDEIASGKNLSEEEREIESRFLIDPFSRSSEYYYYIPIIKQSTGSCEAFKLLSAGIDGKVDNVMTDQVFTTDNLNLKLYSGYSFNPLTIFFGSKDNLVYEGNGIARIRENVYEELLGDSISANLSSNEKMFLFQPLMVEGIVKRDTVIGQSRVLYLSSGDLKMECRIYKGESIDTRIDDKLRLVGIYHGKSPTDDTVIFINCLSG